MPMTPRPGSQAPPPGPRASSETAAAIVTPSYGRYRILGTLGSGGFGKVYHARYLGLRGFERSVALKVMHAMPEGLGPELAARLRDEAKLLAQLDHPAIVRVSKLTLVEGCWAVELDHVNGVDLGTVADAPGERSFRGLLELVAVVADALAYAHAVTDNRGHPMRLVHRDIKPSNIMLTARGEVKVLDFGIARAEFEARESRTVDHVFGTPAYMAPERFDFDNGPHGDVYALGATLLHLLSPSRAPLGPALRNKNEHNDGVLCVLNDLDGLLPGHPRTVNAVLDLICAMMRFEPQARPTAAEVRERLWGLATRADGPSLAKWAPELVPPLLAQLQARRTSRPSPDVGRELVEHGEQDLGRCAPGFVPEIAPRGPFVTPPEGMSAWDDVPVPPLLREVSAQRDAVPQPVAPASSSKASPLTVGSAVVAFVLVVLGGLALAQGWPREATAAGAEGGSAPTAVAPAPEASEALPAPAELPTVTPQAVEARAPRRAASGVPVAVTGTDFRAALVVEGRRVALPARVAPGRYRLEVRFSDGEVHPSGTVDVVEGEPLTIRCDPSFLRCAVVGL